MTQMNLSTKQKQTQGHREQTCGCQGRGGWGEIEWVVWVSRCRLLHTECVNKFLLYNTGNYIQYSMINNNGNNILKKNVCVYKTESLCCKEKITTTLQTK